MKTLAVLSFGLMLTLPALAGSSMTTTRVYESESRAPIDSEFEAQEEARYSNLDRWEQERMEERQRMEEARREPSYAHERDRGIDYTDRTRMT